MAYSPLGQGRAARATASLSRSQRGLGATPAQVALAWLLAPARRHRDSAIGESRARPRDRAARVPCASMPRRSRRSTRRFRRPRSHGRSPCSDARRRRLRARPSVPLRARTNFAVATNGCDVRMTRRGHAWHACCSIVGKPGYPSARRRTEEGRRDYTHYDYLDLAPGASPAGSRPRTRSCCERFGYGATDAGQDLSGLVRMIHAAYEVLSNPESRRRYDAELAHEAAMADAELKATLDPQASCDGPSRAGSAAARSGPPLRRWPPDAVEPIFRLAVAGNLPTANSDAVGGRLFLPALSRPQYPRTGSRARVVAASAFPHGEHRPRVRRGSNGTAHRATRSTPAPRARRRPCRVVPRGLVPLLTH